MTTRERFQSELDRAIDEGHQIQLVLEGLPPGQALGPAEIKSHGDGCYTMITIVQMGHGAGAPTVRSPMTFTIDRVIWFSSGPVDEEGKPLVKSVSPLGIPGGIFSGGFGS